MKVYQREAERRVGDEMTADPLSGYAEINLGRFCAFKREVC